MQSQATTVAQYLKELPTDRRKSLQAVRKVIKQNLPDGYQETMQYGMISYVVPLKRYPQGYLDKKDVPLPYAALASQKNHMAIYLNTIYSDKKTAAWFQKEYKKTGKKMDVGKSCIRFKQAEDLPIELIGQAIAATSVDEYIAQYETTRQK